MGKCITNFYIDSLNKLKKLCNIYLYILIYNINRPDLEDRETTNFIR